MNVWHKNISDILLLPSQLYLESECNGLSSDLQYGISRSHLNHRRQKVMVKLQTYGTSRPHLNYRRQLLRWLHPRDRCGTKTYLTFSCSPSWTYFESECDGLSSDLWYLQISFEPLTSTLHGIDHASDIIGSVSNQVQQLLRWLHSRDECGTKHIRYSLASLATELKVRMWWSSFRPMVSPNLIWNTDVRMWWSNFRPMEPPDLIWTTDVNYWDDCIHEIDVAQNIKETLFCHNITDISIALVTASKIRMWWSQFRPMVPPHLI